MFCSFHKERIAISTCVSCGRGICAECQTIIQGQYWCRDCSGSQLSGFYLAMHARNPWVAAIASLLLPGIGQVYNGQVSKGIMIFLSCWLVVPWIYGVFDAFIYARKFNRGEYSAKPKTGCLIGCLVIVFVVAASPFLVIKAIQYYSLMAQINTQESVAIKTLFKVSEAAENFYKVNNRYPENYSELYFAQPPYIREIYCDVSVGGGKYNCFFSRKGYLVIVKPEADSLLKNTFSISTGGVMVPFEQTTIPEVSTAGKQQGNKAQ
jgi:TM2 domain-containing membrane protein YozV